MVAFGLSIGILLCVITRDCSFKRVNLSRSALTSGNRRCWCSLQEEVDGRDEVQTGLPDLCVYIF